MRNWLSWVVLGTAVAVALPAASQVTATLGATVRDTTGTQLGLVTITLVPRGGLIRAELTGLLPGPHGFNIHSVGTCSATPQTRPEDPAPFQTAGGHLNPAGTQHGFLNPAGPHLGDMPNLIVPVGGAVVVEYFVPGIDMAVLMDADKSALVIRAGPDDYQAGGTGARIACGVIEPRP